MPFSNAEKQRRYRERNQILLSANASVIAKRLIRMSDQNKLRRVAAFINDHLQRPEGVQSQRGGV